MRSNRTFRGGDAGDPESEDTNAGDQDLGNPDADTDAGNPNSEDPNAQDTQDPSIGGRRRRRSMRRSMRKSRKSRGRSRRQTAGRRKHKSKHSRRLRRTRGG